MQRLLGNEFEQFYNSLQQIPPVSVRIHPFKKTDLFNAAGNVPWCPLGKYLESRPEFVFDPLFHAGAYYVQEASSMAIVGAIDFSKDMKVLDLCAAPGGKSTLMASFLSNGSLLVSNEAIKSRVRVLQENITRWGMPNVVVTNNDSSAFNSLENYFDVIVVDAPCSGEGMFRKDEEAIRQWSEKHIAHCAERQQRILQNIIPSLKPGGLLVYSTCTFSQEENEIIVEWLLKEFPHQLEPVRLDFPAQWNISNGHHEDKMIQGHTYRFYPHRIKGEGLFLACLKKRSGSTPSISTQKDKKRKEKPTTGKASRENVGFLEHYLSEDLSISLFSEGNKMYACPENMEEDIVFLKEKLNVRQWGILTGEIKGSDFIPAHDFAMSELVSKHITRQELSKEDALRFLKKESLEKNANMPAGWCLVTFKSIPLGWVKVIGDKIKNYFPTDWRIRKEVRF